MHIVLQIPSLVIKKVKENFTLYLGKLRPLAKSYRYSLIDVWFNLDLIINFSLKNKNKG